MATADDQHSAHSEGIRPQDGTLQAYDDRRGPLEAAPSEPPPMAIAVGDNAALNVEVTEDAVRAFVALSGDDAPLHTQPEFAIQAGFTGPVVHGALIAAYVSQLVGTKIPGRLSVLQKMELSFRHPCYAPCQLLITGRIRQVSEATRTVTLDISVEAGGKVIVTGKTAHLMIPQP
jgi:3-hydroxybutyryl-CoA dehydratase